MDESLRRPAPITVRDVARIMRRRWPIAVVTFLLVCAAVAAATKKMQPVYESQASVILDTPSNGNGLSPELMAFMGHAAGAPLDTEIAKIQRRVFLEGVIAHANLGDMRYLDLKNRLTLSAGAGGQVLNIGVRARTAVMAQTIANTVANDYIEAAKSEFLEKTNLAEKRLMLARDDSFAQKQKAEAALQRFTASMGNSDPNLIFDREAHRTVDVSTALADAQKNLPLQQAQLASLNDQLKRIPDTVVGGFGVNKFAAIDSLQNQISDLKVQRQDKLYDYTPDNDEVKALDKAIADREQEYKLAQQTPYSVGSKSVSRNGDYSKVQSEIWDAELSLKASQKSIAASQRQLATLEAEQQMLSPKKITYEQLLHARDDANDAFERARSGLFNLEQSLFTAEPYIHVLDDAPLPPAPISPRPLLNGIMAVALGLILGLGTALMAEYLAGGFVPVEEISPILDLPMIGGIPLLGALPIALPTPLSAHTGDRDLPVPLHLATHRGEVTEDVLREIGYCLTHRANAKDPAPVVLLTSVRGDDSTATLAAQLTATLVRDGMRVTLIDADRDHPRLNRFFGAPDAPGLSDVLARRTGLREALHVGVDGSLRFLAAGSPEDRRPPDEGRLREVFEELTAGDATDVVFVSGPAVWNARQIGPLEKATRGMVLLTFADALSGSAPDHSVARVRRLLSNGYKPDILGVIVGQTDSTSVLTAIASTPLSGQNISDDEAFVDVGEEN